MTRFPSALTLALLDTAPPAEDPVRWRRDVEVEFFVRGVPGLRTIVGVRHHPAFDPPEAIACSRPCTAMSFRWPWEWPVPLRRRVPR